MDLKSYIKDEILEKTEKEKALNGIGGIEIQQLDDALTTLSLVKQDPESNINAIGIKCRDSHPYWMEKNGSNSRETMSHSLYDEARELFLKEMQLNQEIEEEKKKAAVSAAEFEKNIKNLEDKLEDVMKKQEEVKNKIDAQVKRWNALQQLQRRK